MRAGAQGPGQGASEQLWEGRDHLGCCNPGRWSEAVTFWVCVKAELLGLPSGLAVGFEKAVKDESLLSGLSKWRDGAALEGDGKGARQVLEEEQELDVGHGKPEMLTGYAAGVGDGSWTCEAGAQRRGAEWVYDLEHCRYSDGE